MLQVLEQLSRIENVTMKRNQQFVESLAQMNPVQQEVFSELQKIATNTDVEALLEVVDTILGLKGNDMFTLTSPETRQVIQGLLILSNLIPTTGLQVYVIYSHKLYTLTLGKHWLQTFIKHLLQALATNIWQTLAINIGQIFSSNM